MVTAKDVLGSLGVTLDSSAVTCWQFAGEIGDDSRSDSRVSYTSLLLALLFSENDVSRWFGDYAQAFGVDVSAIEGEIGLSPGAMEIYRTTEEEHSPSGSKNEVTASASAVAENAATIARALSAESLGVRHLLAGYFYPPDGNHAKQLALWNIDTKHLATQFQKFVRARYFEEAGQWLDVHARHYDNAAEIEASGARLAGFAADTPEGDDFLGIQDDVYAFAALICSTRVAPPLSIGLFGEWGGGKSFFLRRLQQGVKWIAQDTRAKGRMQKEAPFYKNVVQIEFNAWNYSGGNLWAALVQHILENLRLTPHDEDDLVGARRKHLEKEMELESDAKQAALTRKDAAQANVDELRERVKTLRSEHKNNLAALADTVNEDVWRSIKVDATVHAEIKALRARLGLPGEVDDTAGEVLASVDAVRGLLTRTSALLRAVPEDQRRGFIVRSAVVLGAPVVLAAIGGLVVAWLLDSEIGASVTAFLTWVTTAVGCGASWVRTRSKAVGEALAKLESLRAHAQLRVEQVQQERKGKIASLEKEIALSRDEIVAAENRQREAELRLQRLEAELAATTTARVLEDFIRERAESDDYRMHLGLPAVIRRDFERISKMIAAENKSLDDLESIEEENADAGRRINRIVLYIDDLDRCPEELVVEVLSAVHLLLAFPLFVVVVAVDVRWVSQSLAKRYPGLLSGASTTRGGMSASASPTDYLEKIFQVPFWIRPPGESAVAKMMRNLLQDAVPAAARSERVQGAAPESARAVVLNEGGFSVGKHDPDGRSLSIEAAELAFIESLAPSSRSPRALKRFVNIYRLFKSSLAGGDEVRFVATDPGEGAQPGYQCVLLLLAIENGLPRVSDVLLRRLIARGDQPVADVALGPFVRDLGANDLRTRRQAETLQTWLRGRDWENRRARLVRYWAPRVAQFSYRSYA